MENKPNYTFTPKNDPSLLTNHMPITLANTIYKLFTSTLTLILSTFGKNTKYYMIAQKNSKQKETYPDNYVYSLRLYKTPNSQTKTYTSYTSYT